MGAHFDDFVGGRGIVFADGVGGGLGAGAEGADGGVHAAGFAWLAGGWGREAFFHGCGDGGGRGDGGFVVGDFAESGAFAALAVVGGSGGLGVGEGAGAGRGGGGFGGGGGHEEGEPFFHGVFPPPFAEGALV